MKRKAVKALLIIICFILQCTVFQALSLAGIVPNLLLIVTSSLGFMRGEKEGMAVGFFSGLLTDIFFGQLFGFYSLLYMFLGYGSGLFHMMFYDDDIKLPMTWIALSELVYGLSVYFFMFLMRNQTTRNFSISLRWKNRFRPFSREAAPNSANIECRTNRRTFQRRIPFLSEKSFYIQ